MNMPYLFICHENTTPVYTSKFINDIMPVIKNKIRNRRNLTIKYTRLSGVISR